MKPRNKTTRITFKHGCWYYRPRASEKALFGGKSWYRLDPDRYVALAKFAEIMRLGVDNTVASVIDRYIIECVPLLRAATRPVYKRGLERLSRVLGHNPVAAITPHVMYQYRDGLISAGRSMNVANADGCCSIARVEGASCGETYRALFHFMRPCSIVLQHQPQAT